MKYFVTGTDTGVGKTRVTALLARALEARGEEPLALKPVCSGSREDAEILRAACGSRLTMDEVNPFWFPEPLAPHLAARGAGREVEPKVLLEWYRAVSGGKKWVLVEGAGGWLVPLAPGRTMADFALALGLPVLLVVANRLGCINHCLLTLESIRARGLTCTGIVLNSPHEPDHSTTTNRAAIEEFGHVPVILEIAHGQESVTLPPAIFPAPTRLPG